MTTYHCSHCSGTGCILTAPEVPTECPFERGYNPFVKWEEVSNKFEDWHQKGLDNRDGINGDDLPFGCVYCDDRRCMLHCFYLGTCYDSCVNCTDFKVVK